MKMFWAAFAMMFALLAGTAYADEFEDTVNKFRQSPATQPFFQNAYAYAIFPTVGKGGVVVGGAYGEGRVYRGGSYIGDVSLVQLSVGWQLGGQTYSELIFFENQEALDWFTHDSFSFDARASAVAISVGAGAQAGSSGASGNVHTYQTKAAYLNHVAVFSMQKGGLMYEASLAGQKFTYHSR